MRASPSFSPSRASFWRSRCSGECPAAAVEWCAALPLTANCTSIAESFVDVCRNYQILLTGQSGFQGDSHFGQREAEKKQLQDSPPFIPFSIAQVLSPPRLSTGAGPRQHGHGAAACSLQGLPLALGASRSFPNSVHPTLTELATNHSFAVFCPVFQSFPEDAANTCALTTASSQSWCTVRPIWRLETELFEPYLLMIVGKATGYYSVTPC